MSETKKFLLQQYDKYMDIKSKNVDVIELINEISNTKNELNMAELKLDNAMFTKYSQILEELNSRLTCIIKIELSDLYIKYSDIFEMIVIRNIERVVLESVLTQYELFKKGQIAERDAVKQGIKFVNKKYKLPNGFLDENRADDFIKNKGKNYEEEDDTF